MSYNKMFTDPQDGLKLGAFQKLLFFSKKLLKAMTQNFAYLPFYTVCIRNCITFCLISNILTKLCSLNMTSNWSKQL